MNAEIKSAHPTKARHTICVELAVKSTKSHVTALNAGSKAKEKAKPKTRSTSRLSLVERMMGIEPTTSAWEADVLPLNYTRR